MPLVTQIERDGESVPLPWNWWHVQCILLVAERQCPENPRVLQDTGEFVVREDAAFTMGGTDEEKAAIVGEANDLGWPEAAITFEVKRGDILRMWREV